MTLENQKQIPTTTDLLRSAIVLSVASMDAYFTDKFSDLLVPELKKKNKKIGKPLENLLKEAGLDDLQECLSLLAMKRPYRRIRAFVTTYLETKTTQRLKAIDKLYLCFGIKKFCASVEGRLGRKNLLTRVQKLVERRHQIVHDGDYTRHHKLRPIDSHQTSRYLVELLDFVAAADSFLNEMFKKQPKNN